MRRWSVDLTSLLTPRRRRGIEYLDDPRVDGHVMRRSLRDVTVANRLFGGTRAIVSALDSELDALRASRATEATLLDVGTGLGDIPRRAQAVARQRGITLHLVGLDGSEVLARAASATHLPCARGDARHLPFADRSVDFVVCSQLLHHFDGSDGPCVLRELNRVARRMVIVGELRRSWAAAAGIWVASFVLAFHPVSRHDGVVSVMRGFTKEELRMIVREVLGVEPEVRNRLGYRVTARWRPLGDTK
ncbi:MAG TPA: methyltransferase domain-containing protein [Gemmatimonadaceae bacterium]|jgi:SAM-dependent methyltransferase|nr:methyltransferase domain-containing protein [Gemmatimonadaceae bacterium]